MFWQSRSEEFLGEYSIVLIVWAACLAPRYLLEHRARFPLFVLHPCAVVFVLINLILFPCSAPREVHDCNTCHVVWATFSHGSPSHLLSNMVGFIADAVIVNYFGWCMYWWDYVLVYVASTLVALAMTDEEYEAAWGAGLWCLVPSCCRWRESGWGFSATVAGFHGLIAVMAPLDGLFGLHVLVGSYYGKVPLRLLVAPLGKIIVGIMLWVEIVMCDWFRMRRKDRIGHAAHFGGFVAGALCALPILVNHRALAVRGLQDMRA